MSAVWLATGTRTVAKTNVDELISCGEGIVAPCRTAFEWTLTHTGEVRLPAESQKPSDMSIGNPFSDCAQNDLADKPVTNGAVGKGHSPAGNAPPFQPVA